MHGFVLNQLKDDYYKDERVCDWDYLVPGNDLRIRLYYRPDDKEGLGFSFYAIEETSNPCIPETENGNIIHPDYTSVDVIFYGVAHFDGIRHLFYGHEDSNNFGYHYCPVLGELISLFNLLRELELRYCREPL